MVVRRKVLPYIAHTIWDGIRQITHQRQLANVSRLLKLLQKERPELTAAQAEQYITDCIDEGVIVPAPKGLGPQSYVLPLPSDIKPSEDSHDWYCIECHWPGDVEMCQTCHRVFHLDCKSRSNDKKTETTLAKSRTNQSRKSLEIPDLNYSNSSSNLNDSQSKEKLDPSTDQSLDASSQQIIESTSIPNLKVNERESNGDMDTNIQNNEEKICSICQLINMDDFKIDPEELNYLMGFILSRIKSWLPAKLTDSIGTPELEPWAVQSDAEWKGHYLLHTPTDMNVIEEKARKKGYKKLNEIHADILSIKHNVAVYHGRHSTEVQAVDYMLVDACHDIDEIRQCIDCYHNSNEKKNRRWFCIPCKQPHELVWAKQKGFSYWPAKVIKRQDRQYDVRFFGAKYLRAVIDQNFVKPINVPLMNLKIKRSPAFNKAYEELQLHQEWLKKPFEMSKYLSSKSPKRERGKNVRNTIETPSKASNITNKRPSNSNESVTKKRKSTSSPTASRDNTPARELRTRTSLQKTDGISNSILISDAEDDETIQSQDDLISSTQDIRCQIDNKLDPLNDGNGSSPDNPPRLSDNKNIEAAEKLRSQLEVCEDRQKIIQLACDTVQEQVDRFTEKIRSIVASQAAVISNIKKKQWCYNCEQEAIYHCCWNTSYCSTECQQMHWHTEHKRNCRRKRP